MLATQVITLCQQTPGACVVSKPPAHQPNHCTAPISAESKLVSLFIFLGWSAVGLMRGRGWIQNSEGRSRLFQNVTKSKTWIWTDFEEEEKKTRGEIERGRRRGGIILKKRKRGVICFRDASLNPFMITVSTLCRRDWVRLEKEPDHHLLATRLCPVHQAPP